MPALESVRLDALIDDRAAQAERSRSVALLCTLARELHACGTTAPRLEAALRGIADRLGLSAQIWSGPTLILLSIRDASLSAGAPVHTELLRVEPNDINLGRLSMLDDIAEAIVAGQMDMAEAEAALSTALKPVSKGWNLAQTLLGFPLASASVAGLLRAHPNEIVASAAIGLLIGLLALASERHPRLGENLSVIAAFLAALSAAAFANWIAPVAFKVVLIASLIVLMPGLTLTVAVAELGMRHLVSGSARLAGGVVTLLELAFGALAGSKAAELMGSFDQTLTPGVGPNWLPWAVIPLAGLAFSLIFRARLTDWPFVFIAAAVAFAVSHYGTFLAGPEMGLFFAALLLALISNAFARYLNRPGALLRVPGLILLVPGSVGFRSLSFIFEKDVFLGLDAAFSVIVMVASLAAGLLLGNSLLPPRRLTA